MLDINDVADDAVLNRKDLCNKNTKRGLVRGILNISENTLKRYEAAGDFPESFTMGRGFSKIGMARSSRKRCYRAGDIKDWMRKQVILK